MNEPTSSAAELRDESWGKRPILDVPPPPPDAAAPFEEREAYWLKHVYQGDRMPQLTIRAVLMGGAIGMLMSISNLYTVLKVGWLFGVAITACVMSYVIWNLMRALSFGRLSQMTILENACMASTASAAGYSTGSTIGTMFGATLILESKRVGGNVETWTATPWLTVSLFTLCTAALGVFIAIPMKRQMINREQLPFPSGIAAAATLRSLYSEGRQAVRQAYALLTTLFLGVLVGVINSSSETYRNAVGEGRIVPRFFDWVDRTLFGWLPELWPHFGFRQISPNGQMVDAVVPASALADGTIAAATLDASRGKMLPGFGFEPSALLIAAGMIVGHRVTLSMLLGSVILYFGVGPWLIAQDTLNAGVDGYVRSVAMNGAETAYRLTVWALWAGTAVMITCSLTALALQWKVIVRSFNIFQRGSSSATGAAASVEVPFKWFIIGMIPITIAMVAVAVIGFHIHWYWAVVAVGLAFVLSLVAARSTGETDTTPIGAMGKVMQLFFGLVQPGAIMPNLASAGIAANGASASSDLLTDLKTGYVLGANPRKQFIAQFAGIFFGTAAIVPAWYLMVPNSDTIQTYPLPSTIQWVAVAELLTQGVNMLPVTARWAILFGAIVGVMLPISERLSPKPIKPFIPSAMGLGLSWIMPFNNALAFAVGGVIQWAWSKLSRSSWSEYNIAIASGFIAGEGLIKALIAMSATVVGLSAG